MKVLRDLLDSFHPLFTRGGKFERLYPLYEAGDTFLFTPGEVTHGPSHVRDSLDLKRMMSVVVLALIPCIYMACWNTGYQANLAMQQLDLTAAPGWRGAIMTAIGGCNPASLLSNVIHGALYFFPVLIVSYTVGGICEVIFCCIRKHDINEGFLVTGMLFPLTLPPTIPLWQVALGIAFAVVFGKEVYGGTGKNFLNPALTARAFLYFSYPGQIIGNVWIAVFTKGMDRAVINNALADGYTGATALGAIANAPAGKFMGSVTDVTTNGGIGMTWFDAFMGWIPGSMGETSTLCCLIGAVILIASGIGSWRIMVGCLIGMLGFSALLYGVFLAGLTSVPTYSMPPWWHLVVGGFAFGTVFMATDPVSASMTNTGRWIYGILCGAMTILVRVVNPAFPEGIMLAILFGNCFAPLIDYFVVQANINRRLARNATT
jgi:Na+-transporting NADH:ubiquinone oxidoreductase subunit B